MKTTTLLLALLTLLVPATVHGQSLEEEVRSLRAEIQRLRQEVDTLREEVHGKTPGAAETDLIPVLQTQIQEQAQTKVETSSKFPMKLFGSIVSNTFWNSAEPNWLDIPNIAGPKVAGQPAGSFTSSMRQSRIGAILDGPRIGTMKSSAFVTMDFFGGVPNFSTGQTMGLPRLLYAYARLESARTAVEIGQDHMILAPRNPTSLAAESFPLMYRSGNLYLRVPQIRAERVIASGDHSEVRATGGILAPVAGDTGSHQFEFVPLAQAGERSRMPALQARLAWKATASDPYDKPAWEIGASAHYSRERYNSPGVSNVEPGWATAFDFDRSAGRFGTGGEIFVGRNIDAFGGSVAQLAKSHGGFIEGRFAATRRLSLNGGYGTDRLFDINRFHASLERNSSAFANGIFRFTPEFAASVEYRWLGTKPRTADLQRNNHVNLTFAYSF